MQQFLHGKALSVLWGIGGLVWSLSKFLLTYSFIYLFFFFEPGSGVAWAVLKLLGSDDPSA